MDFHHLFLVFSLIPLAIISQLALGSSGHKITYTYLNFSIFVCKCMYICLIEMHINVVCCFRERGSVLRLTTDSAASSLSVTFDPTRVTQLSWRPRSTSPSSLMCLYFYSVSISLFIFRNFEMCHLGFDV